MTITTQTFDYQDGDTACIGYVAWDDSVVSARPTVLINHAWSGRDGFADNIAVQMAANGYVGVALDNYGAGAQPDTIDEKMALMGPLKEDRKALLSRLTAGYKAASALPMVDTDAMAAIGFCFGGLCTLDMARAGLDLKAAISCHGFLNAPDFKSKKITADILVCHGWNDPMVPSDQVVAFGEEMVAAGGDWTLMAFGNTQHAFTVPGANQPDVGNKYNKSAADQSWATTFDLLRKHFELHGTTSKEGSA